MRQTRGGPSVQFPTLPPEGRQLLIVLFGLYVVELVVQNFVPIQQLLAWRSLQSGGFLPFQPLTRFFVQGSSVISVAISGFVLFLILPTLFRLFSRRQLLEALGTSIAVSTVLGLVLDAIGIAHGATMGWQTALTTCFVLFGFAQPNARILLFFVLPVSGTLIAWGTGAIALLYFLVDQNLNATEAVGMWIGAWLWWNQRGPGARRRDLRKKARKVEDELRRFQVLEGGRHDGDNRDEWVN